MMMNEERKNCLEIKQQIIINNNNLVQNDDHDQVQKCEQRKLKIAVLRSCYEGTSSIFKDVDPPPEIAAEFNPDPDKYEFEVIALPKASALMMLSEFIRDKKYDLFYNKCDGMECDETAGIEVCQFLHRKNNFLPIISPEPEFLMFSKQKCKFVAETIDIATPKYFFITAAASPEQIKRIIAEKTSFSVNAMKFPLIVKHYSGAGSEGLDECSKVETISQLEKKIEIVVKRYGGALVEEFITGREFTVLITENPQDPYKPIVYSPFECILSGPEDFKYFKAKFIEFNAFKWRPVFGEQKLADELKQMTAKMFQACNGTAYARADFRMCERTGRIYFLELNVMPCVFYPKGFFGSADFILEHDSETMGGHKTFLNNLIDLAFQKWYRLKEQIASKNVTAMNNATKFGYLKATRNLSAGQIVVDLTRLPNRIVTKAEYESWSVEAKKVFSICSVPIKGNSLRLWLTNHGHQLDDFEVSAILRADEKRCKSSSAKDGSLRANCTLDSDLCLVAIRQIDEGDNLIMDENIL